MTLRALRAIVEERMRNEALGAIYACVAAVIVGLLAPHGLAGPVFFCSLLGVIMALLQSPGRFPHLDLCEQSAPLFGRQLARAKALVPCIVAAAAVAAYLLAAEAAGSRDLPLTLLATFGAVIAATLTALCASVRTGMPRRLYIAMACAVSAAAFGIVTAGGSLLGELAFATLVSFLALRQYGEALARYDPV